MLTRQNNSNINNDRKLFTLTLFLYTVPLDLIKAIDERVISFIEDSTHIVLEYSVCPTMGNLANLKYKVVFLLNDSIIKNQFIAWTCDILRSFKRMYSKELPSGFSYDCATGFIPASDLEGTVHVS